MKRIIMTAVAVVFASSLALAQGPGKGFQKGPGGDKGKIEESRKEMMKGRQELNDLGENYRAETDANKKAAIKTQIETKAGQTYDDNIAAMKKRGVEARERLADMDKKLDEAQKPEVRAQRVQEITQRVLEGKPGKDGKDLKKDGKGKKDKKSFKK